LKLSGDRAEVPVKSTTAERPLLDRSATRHTVITEPLFKAAA
jgi:hypothetical protein